MRKIGRVTLFFHFAITGLKMLYQPEVVRLYLSLLGCSHNANTLEAAAGALQNLAAGHWTVSGHSLLTAQTGESPLNPALILTVVQLHSSHGAKREGSAHPGGAAALRRG